jgi:CcmD family protein
MTHSKLAGRIVVALIVVGIAGAATSSLTARQPVPGRQPSIRPSVWERPQATGQQNEFVPLKDLVQREQLPAAPLVMGAYAFVWVALLVYVWSLWRRVGAVQRELTDLRRRVERKA